MNIVKATKSFEKWLAKRTPIVAEDLRLKHEHMAADEFSFFRATFYRWMQLWPKICGELSKTPHLLAVGDLHVENFGTWRDLEGRLIWGVNDFDEATVLSFAVDLVRLATSAMIAIEQRHVALKIKDALRVILEGYSTALAEQGRPFVLSEKNKWLREVATGELRDPEHFWAKMDQLPQLHGGMPPSAEDAIQHLMPEPKMHYALCARRAGLGSLGRMRIVAIADWRGGRVAREAKALVPSAIYWNDPKGGPIDIDYQAIIGRAVRCPDPFVQLRGRWIVRRLAPYCSRIELSDLPTNHDSLKLLSAMGYETGNIHLGTPSERVKIQRCLKELPKNWLLSAATKMKDAVGADWRDWRKHMEKKRLRAAVL